MARERFIQLMGGVAITEKQRLALIKKYLNREVSVKVEREGSQKIRVSPLSRVRDVIIDENGEKVEPTRR